MSKTHELYRQAADQILEHLQAGTRPWVKGWQTVGLPTALETGKAYRGFNALWLSMHGGSGHWCTFKAAQRMGGRVKKGAKSQPIFFFDKVTKEDRETGETVTFPILKAYRVFDAQADCEGLEHRIPAPPAQSAPGERHARAEAFIKAQGAEILHGGNQACYMPDLDTIRIPEYEAFISAEEYYATALHELTHWTKHPSRCDRSARARVWGDEIYAAEELVAEFGAAMVCASLGIDSDLPNHASYIATWQRKLKDHPQALMTALSQAQKAADWLHDNAKAAALSAAA